MAYKEVTIYDIAERLSISTATVSRGLNNSPVVSPQTRQRVQEAARELGYRPNTFASSLRRQRTNTIGVIVPRLNSSFMSSVLYGFERVADRAGYHLIISQTLEQWERERANVANMFHRRVDALVVSLAYNTPDTSHFDLFLRKKIPVVFFDRVCSRRGSPVFVIDNRSAGYEIAQHLLEQGCRRIAHITGNLLRNVYADRLQGYLQALGERGVTAPPELILQTDLSLEAGVSAARQILAMTPRPDGLFVSNDTCAISCMDTLKQAGVSIPHQMAVVGFNNDPMGQFVNPPLSSYNYSGQELGEVVMRSLIDHLAGNGSMGLTDAVILKSNLVIRESSRRVPAQPAHGDEGTSQPPEILTGR